MNNYTIILAHGIARFDYLTHFYYESLNKLGIHLEFANNELHYFKGISRHLRQNGFNTFPSEVSFAGDLETRANDLEREVETALALRPEQPKVHIIAHSMGGLDARLMICKPGMADKIASLTTVGTPHFGTSLADFGVKNGGHDLIEVLSKVINIEGFADLTTYAADAFNLANEAFEAGNEVFYQTYSASEKLSKIFAPLQPAWEIINQHEGANDGLVPVSSQRWKRELSNGSGITKTVRQKDFPIPADHLNEIGWWDFNEFKAADLLQFNLLKTVSDYENTIKNVYLEIAEGVKSL